MQQHNVRWGLVERLKNVVLINLSLPGQAHRWGYQSRKECRHFRFRIDSEKHYINNDNEREKDHNSWRKRQCSRNETTSSTLFCVPVRDEYFKKSNPIFNSCCTGCCSQGNQNYSTHDSMPRLVSVHRIKK
jgi:hypothetical protein